MQIKFDISDPATIRGIVRLVGSIAAIAALFVKDQATSVLVLSITGMAVGAVGVSTVQTPPEAK